jgi:hypothetical protein
MMRSLVVAVTIVAASIILNDPIFAQTPSPTTETPKTGMRPDRTIADEASRKMMREKRAALKQKRAECRKQARAQKVSLLNRRRFIRDCMSH